MPTRPRLARSIPFWTLIVASLASVAAGVMLLADKLGVMTTTILDGTATGVEVYVGQSLAVVGAVLVGAGVVGILLALTIASLSTLRPHAPVALVAAPDAADADELDAPEAGHGYERGLGYTEVIDTVEDEKELSASR